MRRCCHSSSIKHARKKHSSFILQKPVLPDWTHREAELNLALEVSAGIMSLRNVNTPSLLGWVGHGANKKQKPPAIYPATSFNETKTRVGPALFDIVVSETEKFIITSQYRWGCVSLAPAT